MNAIKLPKLTCLRCKKSWTPRKDGIPLRCGKCKTPYWNLKPKVKK
jgi:hypothetical protein